jgi:hypothetical protein
MRWPWRTILSAFLILIGSITLAVVIPSHQLHCSYPAGAPPPPCPADNLVALRIGTGVAGLILVVLVFLFRHVWRRWRQH